MPVSSRRSFATLIIVACATACSTAVQPIRPTTSGDETALLIADARAFMDSYGRALRDGDRNDIVGRYHPDGVYRMGEGRKRLLTPSAVHAIYHGPWQPPTRFEWRDLSFEVVGPNAVAVMGLFVWGEDSGQDVLYSYTGLLLRWDGRLYIRVEDESSATALDSESSSDSLTRELTLLDAAVSGAIQRRDPIALDTLYSEDFLWRHWDGSIDTKSSWLAFLDSVDYRRHESTTTALETFANAAIVSGTIQSRGRYINEDGEFAYTIRYARIYLFDEQTRRWRLQQQFSRRQEPVIPLQDVPPNGSLQLTGRP